MPRAKCLHHMLKGTGGGRFRRTRIREWDQHCPAPEDVERMLIENLDLAERLWYRQDVDLHTKAAAVAMAVVQVHPFEVTRPSTMCIICIFKVHVSSVMNFSFLYPRSLPLSLPPSLPDPLHLCSHLSINLPINQILPTRAPSISLTSRLSPVWTSASNLCPLLHHRMETGDWLEYWSTKYSEGQGSHSQCAWLLSLLTNKNDLSGRIALMNAS
jgi:hypothetical protein